MNDINDILQQNSIETMVPRIMRYYRTQLNFYVTRLYEKFPPPNPRGADRGAHVRSSNL
jgi:hypothetical protein